MRIGIIDDEEYFQEILSTQLKKIFPTSQIDCYLDINENIYNQAFDILFLDVMLSTKKSFGEGQKILNKKTTNVLVYISAFDSFVYDSYSQNTFFFIRKSNLEDDLKKFITKYIKLTTENMRSITVKYKGLTFDLLEQNIVYLESFRNKITIHTLKTEICVYESLKHVYKELNHNCFYRFNSHIVINLNHVMLFSNIEISMDSGEKIFYTRNSKKRFISEYMNFLERGY